MADPSSPARRSALHRRSPRSALRPSRRQPNNCWGVSPCRRATTDTAAPASSLSATIRALSSTVQRRRPPPPVITSMRRTWRSGSSVGSSLDTSRSLSRSRISTITDQELHRKAAPEYRLRVSSITVDVCATRSRYQCSACSVGTPGVLLGSENYTIQSRRGVTPLISHSLPIAVLLAAAKPSGYSLSTLESSNACPNVSTSRIRTGEGLHRRWRSRTANHRGNLV
jgi:hypothetical protein